MDQPASTVHRLRLLMVEDSEDDAALLLRTLRREGLEPLCRRVDTPAALRAALREETWNVITCDYVMPGFSGPAALQMVQEAALDIPFLVISGKVDEDTAVSMLKAGAHDFIVKCNLARLAPAIRRELRDAQARRAARQAGAELAARDEQYRTLARASPVGVYYTDGQGGCTYVNARWSAITGLSLAQAAGGGWAGGVHPDDRERVIAEWQRCAAQAKGFSLEYRFRREDGAVTWVLGRAEPQLDEAGRIKAFVGTVTDITQLKATEEALRASERELREAQGVAKLGTWTLDPRTGTVTWSEELYHMFGRDPATAAPRYDEQPPLYSPDTWPRLRSAVDRTLATGAPFELDLELAGGAARWVSARGERITDRDRGVRLRGTAIDITERKVAQLAVEANERRLRALIENSSDFIVVVDERGFLTYASPSLKVTAGYSIPQVLGRNMIEFIHPEDAEAARSQLAMLLTDPQETLFSQLRYRHRDGRWIVLATAAKNVLDDPAVSGIVINARDVTERHQVRERLRLANEVVENSPTVVYLVRREGGTEHCEYVSQNYSQFGYTAEELMSGAVDASRLLEPEDLKRVMAEIDARFAEGAERCHLEYRMRTRSGELRWIESEIRFQRLPGGVVRRQGIMRDVTLRKQQEQRIARLSRIRAVLTGINGLIVRVADEDELIVEACCIAEQQGGFAIALIGVLQAAGHLELVRRSGADAEFFAGIAACMRRGSGCEAFECVIEKRQPLVTQDIRAGACALERETALQHGFGSSAMLPIVVEGSAVALMALYSREAGFFDAEEMGLLDQLAADISFGWDHIVKARRASYLALYDPLTGLGNRTLFAERLAQRLEQVASTGAVAGVCILDLERFNNVNDSLGWHAGDELLRSVSERLKQALGEPNVARTGANSFAVTVCPAADENQIHDRLEQVLQECFGAPFVSGGSDLRLTARCGVALFPHDGGDADTVHKHAAVALERAKESGERLLFYTAPMNARVAERIRLESRLHQAFEGQQFELHYQPKFDARNGALTGLEALIRWNDPTRGLVPPGDFIELLEDTGLIIPVGEWALNQVVDQCRGWHAAGITPPRVAVNVSPKQLRQKDFAPRVREIAARMAGAGALELEITETLIMRDVEENIAKLKSLRDAGISIAIDDFGTGYSSLAYIAKLPVDTVKIDRSFVVAMPDGAEQTGVVFAIISLAHHLELKVVAEGVESEEQARLLRLLRCDEMQGFLFGKPVSGSSMQAFLQKASTAR